MKIAFFSLIDGERNVVTIDAIAFEVEELGWVVLVIVLLVFVVHLMLELYHDQNFR